MGYNVVTGISCTSDNGCGTGGGTIGGNGTFFFTVTAGTTPSSTITLTMPAAGTDWSCRATDRTSGLEGHQSNTAASTTAPALKFYSFTGTLTAPSTGDSIDVWCLMR
jgi:hypothetical protein